MPHPPNPRPRFLGEAEYQDIFSRLTRFSKGGGYTGVAITSSWTGSVRWARNQISMSNEVRENIVVVTRALNGRGADVYVNDTSDVELVAAVRRAERLAVMRPEERQWDLLSRQQVEPAPKAADIFDDATYNMDVEYRSDSARGLLQSAADAGMLSAGFIGVAARSHGVVDTLGHVRYCQFTTAQYTVTVRDPGGTGSGWAGVDTNAWRRIDGSALSRTALDKCLSSRNPVAVEPGRYTVILEPQAATDLIAPMFDSETGSRAMFRETQETLQGEPFHKAKGVSRLGEKVVDERITISADPRDPEMSFPPFSMFWGAPASQWHQFSPFRPVTWIKNGVLADLSYDRDYAIGQLGRSTALQNSGAFRVSGGTTSIEDMIATTKRGLLVTRFVQTMMIDRGNVLHRGYTRDGLWLIENGRISKSVKNLVFTESTLFALNNIEQLGIPKRTYHVPRVFGIPMPAIVPAMKIREFSFTGLTDAV